MNEKSAPHPCFYRLLEASPDGREWVEPTPSTAGPWSTDAQHGGPPAALLARGIERLAGASWTIGRFTMELLGPVPVATLTLSASVLRPGRSVQLVGAELHDVEAGRTVARAHAWVFPVSTSGPGQPTPLAHSPEDGETRPRPEGWHGGYLDAVEWRWIKGSVEEAGPGIVWMRPPRLVEGEETSPVQRLLACVDSASGASAALDVREWGFLNTELSVHLLRPPVGEWVCLDAETTLSTGSVGVATSAAYDGLGLVARSAQALLVVPR
ncbi:thioesterase family protein [Nocardioides ginsengisegetis]